MKERLKALRSRAFRSSREQATDQPVDARADTGFISARRRGFMQGAAVGGVAAASGVAVQAGDNLDIADEPAPGSASAGYQETDHVRRYYRAARN